MQNKPIKPFLKWAGGKFRLVPKIIAVIPQGTALVEPFVGAGSVFLNTQFKSYQLNDINPDLILLYRVLQKSGEEFINFASNYFKSSFNTSKKYYALRKRFNELSQQQQTQCEKAALFLYLNRHGYNGLCRYNRQNMFNVPFGSYKKPHFPEQAMRNFYIKAQQAEFYCEPFHIFMAKAKRNHVVYCDPPYFPLSKTASFTQYAPSQFNFRDQARLAELSEELGGKGISVVISNHDLPETRALYRSAKIHSFEAKRVISCHVNNRKPVRELLAVFGS